MKQNQEIRADYNRDTIIVYQAYGEKIAIPAIKNKKFQEPFSFSRMTWIKPSFLWLMERSNWANKSNQEYILAIRIRRDKWDEALNMGVLTHPDSNVYSSGHDWEEKFANAKIHIQWDPERNFKGTKLNYQSIQVGISRFLIQEYNEEWIVDIEDYTPLVKKIRTLIKEGKYKEAQRLLPNEKVYSIDNEIGKKLR